MSIIRGSLITGTSKAQTSRNIMRLMKLSTQQKNITKKRAIGDKQDKEAARTKEVSRREKESKQRQRQMVKGVSEETDTEKRQKVVAVSRPETAKTPLDARSKLYKQTEIKNKIIDENEVKSMTFQKYHNLPDSLVSAVTAVLEKVKNPFIDDDKKMKSKKDDDQDDDDDTDMKSKKNDDLDDEDEDDSDKTIGTSGKKTKVELKPKTQSANEELKENTRSIINEISKGKAIKTYADAAAGGDYGATDKSYAQSDRLLGHIKKKFGADTGKHAEKAASAAFSGRGTPEPGKDKLTSNVKMRVNASGKVNKQDVDSKKKEIKRRLAEVSDAEFERIEAIMAGSLDEAMKWDKKSHASLPAMDQPSLKAHKEAANWHRENYEDSSGDAKQYHKKRMLHHTTQADAMKSMSESKQFDIGLSDEEEVQQIDELSNKTLRSYAVGANRHLMDVKPAWIRPVDYAKGVAVGAHGKTAMKRAQGGELASKKIAKNIATKNASMKEEVTLTDEETARIAAKLKESDDKAYKYRDTDPADKDNDYDATKDKNPEHIVMQLRKAKSLGAANRPIHFHDGSKVKVSSAHVQKALDMHGSFKRAPEKDEFTQKLQASHSSFKKALGE